MALVQTLSHLKFFLFLLLFFFFFFGKIWEILFFFGIFKKKKIYIYIYMNKVHQMLHGFLEFKEV